MERVQLTRRGLLRAIALGFGATASALLGTKASGQTLIAKNDEETRMTEGGLPKEVHAFLAAYDAAFQTFDAAKIAPFYHVPCVTVRGDGSVHSFQSKTEIETFFRTVAEKYRSDGFHGGTFYDLEVVPMGRRSVLATLTWEQWREDKGALRTWRHSYNLLRTENTWQILASTFHLK